MYDRTGSVEDSEELAGGKFNDLYDYYRGMFAQVRGAGPCSFCALPTCSNALGQSEGCSRPAG